MSHSLPEFTKLVEQYTLRRSALLPNLKLMFRSQRRKALQCLKGILTSSASSLFPLNFSTSSADKTSSAVTYLINNGFSPEAALHVSRRARFKTLTKPDSVLTFFRNSGFSDSQLHSLVKKEPWLLSCDPSKTILPKLDFLLSKGASSSDIVHMVSSAPNFLRRSLENHIIPHYELVKRFVQTDMATILCLRRFANLLYMSYMEPNVQLLLDNGVTEPIIARLILSRPSLLSGKGLTISIEEVKKLGFDTCKGQFLWALIAKRGMNKSKWDAKVDAFKKWGWSEEMVLEAFKRDPLCMLASLDRIDAVMSFWVNQLDWDSLVLAERPVVFRYSFEKRIVPRASVLHYLLSKGLISKETNKLAAFDLTEKLFLRRFVERFEEESSQILKLYEEKLNLKHEKKNGSIK